MARGTFAKTAANVYCVRVLGDFVIGWFIATVRIHLSRRKRDNTHVFTP